MSDDYNSAYHHITQTGIGMAKMALMQRDGNRAWLALQKCSDDLDEAMRKYRPDVWAMLEKLNGMVEKPRVELPLPFPVEPSEYEHAARTFGQAIRDAAYKAGIANADAPADGPLLLMLLDDMVEEIKRLRGEPA